MRNIKKNEFQICCVRSCLLALSYLLNHNLVGEILRNDWFQALTSIDRLIWSNNRFCKMSDGSYHLLAPNIIRQFLTKILKTHLKWRSKRFVFVCNVFFYSKMRKRLEVLSTATQQKNYRHRMNVEIFLLVNHLKNLSYFGT